MFRVLATLAIAASGLIALSACSSAGQPSPNAASRTATSARPATSSSASSPDLATVSAVTASIKIRFLSEVFATPLPSDPAKAKIIEDFRESQILWDRSTEELTIVAPTTEYVTGQALASLRTAVTSGAKDQVALAGTDRLFDTRVTSAAADSATVTSCDDGGKAYLEDLATREKIPTDPSAPQRLLVIWKMAPASGHWTLTSLTVVSPPDPRAKVCQPT